MNNQAISATNHTDPIRSDLATDPEMLELVELFVSELPDRVAAMLACEQRRDWVQLGRQAHQVKGACGSYGFQQLTEYAEKLESACRPPDPDAIGRSMIQLRNAFDRARAD